MKHKGNSAMMRLLFFPEKKEVHLDGDLLLSHTMADLREFKVTLQNIRLSVPAQTFIQFCPMELHRILKRLLSVGRDIEKDALLARTVNFIALILTENFFHGKPISDPFTWCEYKRL